MILDTIYKSCTVKLAEAINAHELDVTGAWADMSGSTFVPGSSHLTTNGVTAVTAAAAPPANMSRVVKQITVANKDDVPHNVVFEMVDTGTNPATRIFQYSYVLPQKSVVYIFAGQQGPTGLQGLPGPGENMIINPFGQIDQANEGAISVFTAPSSMKHVVDGWFGQLYASSGSPVVDAQRMPSGPNGYPGSVRFICTGSASLNPSSYLLHQQSIEFNDIFRTGFGTSYARPLSLTFEAKCTIAPYTFAVSIRNASGQRGYPIKFTIDSANTWKEFTAVIPGDIANYWSAGPNVGMYLTFCIVCYGWQGTDRQWEYASGGIIGAAGQTNTFWTVLGAEFHISAVKLEVAPEPTPMAFNDFERELARCQRRYEKSYNTGVAVGSGGGPGPGEARLVDGLGTVFSQWGQTIPFKVTKRATPTLTMYEPVSGVAGYARDYQNTVSVTAYQQSVGMNSFLGYAVPSSGANINIGFHWVADARI